MTKAWKGPWFEAETGRALSRWLTGGTDQTQLLRSEMSGGHAILRSSGAQPENHVGDLAPNGPAGQRFRKYFAVECKNYAKDPEWWHCITSEKWCVKQWWDKINEECAPHRLEPLLIMCRTRMPTVVMVHKGMASYLGLKAVKLILPELAAEVVTFKDFLESDPEQVLTMGEMHQGTKAQFTAGEFHNQSPTVTAVFK